VGTSPYPGRMKQHVAAVTRAGLRRRALHIPRPRSATLPAPACRPTPQASLPTRSAPYGLASGSELRGGLADG